MNWNMIEGNWRQYRYELLRHWDYLTEQDLSSIAGKRSHFAQLLQITYNISEVDAEQQILMFQNSVTATPSYHAAQHISKTTNASAR